MNTVRQLNRGTVERLDSRTVGQPDSLTGSSSYGPTGSPSNRAASGLTLIELILAVGLMALISTVAFLGYNAAVRAWRAGTELANSLHQGDYIMEQLVMGLRSSCKPFCFIMTDGGDGAAARDSIQWTKIGTSLVGADAPYADMAHSVEVSVRDVTDARGKTRTGLAVRSWMLGALQQTDFDADKVPPVLLSTRVMGFNCRMLDPNQPTAGVVGAKPDLQWMDGWLNTNRLPRAVEITLYLQPSEEGKDPLEMKRIVRIPMAQ